MVRSSVDRSPTSKDVVERVLWECLHWGTSAASAISVGITSIERSIMMKYCLR